MSKEEEALTRKMSEERKIVQIAFRPFTQCSPSYDKDTPDDYSTESTLFALCNDGTIWMEGYQDTWGIYRMEPIPQHELIEKLKEQKEQAERRGFEAARDAYDTAAKADCKVGGYIYKYETFDDYQRSKEPKQS